MVPKKKLFEKQLKIVESRWPYVARLIKKAKVPNVKVINDPVTGNINAVLEIDGKRIMVHSEDPNFEASSIVNKPENRYPIFLVFLGLGLGYYPLAFLKKKGQFIKYMLIVEKDPGWLKFVLQNIDISLLLLHPGCDLMVGIGEEEAYPFLRSYMDNPWDKICYAKVVKIIFHEPSIAMYKEYYTHIIRALRDAIKETLLFYGNDPNDSLIGLDNVIKNIPNIILNPGVKDLKEAFKNKPAICVATGPSLNKNIDLLKEVQDRAIIICCDASLKPLLSRGIRPHIVTSLERVPQVVPFFEGIPHEELKNTWLASCPVVVPEVYETYKGPHIITYRKFAHFEWLGIDKGMLPIGPSSANMNFKIAEYMGCNPIVLVGQDLAFAETGESHAEGSVYGSRAVKPQEGAFFVPGNYTEKVLTTPVWYMFLKHFEYDIANYKGLCINATEGGARIAGTRIMTLKEVIDNFLGGQMEIVETIRNRLKTPSLEEAKKDLERFRKTIEETEEFVNNLLNDFGLLKKKIEEYNTEIVRPILERDLNMLKNKEIEVTKSLLREIEEVKMKYITHRIFYLFLMHVVQPYFISSTVEFNAIYEKYDNINFAYIEIVSKHAEWFNVMIKLVEITGKRLEMARDIINRITF
ncbi:MAG: motility associated factor glycosyltransferase family protein [Thermosulfidibacteraceae bacterium]